jgi:DNA-binding MarR family transcriptional regulator
VTDVEQAARTAARVWYAVEGRPDTAVSIIGALEASSRASAGLQRRIRDASGLGDTDVNAVLFLLASSVESRIVTPKDIAAHLRMSTAAASGLVDRLERAGYVRRASHPSDRRGITVVLTDDGRRRAGETIGRVYSRLLDVAASLTLEDASTVLRFLQAITDEVGRLP